MQKTLGYSLLVLLVVGCVAWVLTSHGPDRLLYQKPSRADATKLVNSAYLMTRDTITVGKRASVSPAGGALTADIAATITRKSEGGSWSISAKETSVTPVLVNGEQIESTTLSSGDTISAAGAEVVYETGRTGPGGFVDNWESGTITHLFLSPTIMAEAFPVVLKAFPIALLIVFVSFGLAVPGGLVLAFMKMAKTRWVRWPATAYIDFIRGTPLFLQILIVFFGLPLFPAYQAFVKAQPWVNGAGLFGLSNSLYLRAFLVLSLNSAAYMAEIFRAGIQSINKGQLEAARSLGMTTPQAMVYVIIPQTVRRILPTMMSEFILLFKDTALLAAAGVGEIVLRAREVAASTFNTSSYVLAAGFYLIITIPLGRVVQYYENKLAVSEGGGGATTDDEGGDTTTEVKPVILPKDVGDYR